MTRDELIESILSRLTPQMEREATRIAKLGKKSWWKQALGYVRDTHLTDHPTAKGKLPITLKRWKGDVLGGFTSTRWGERAVKLHPTIFRQPIGRTKEVVRHELYHAHDPGIDVFSHANKLNSLAQKGHMTGYAAYKLRPSEVSAYAASTSIGEFKRLRRNGLSRRKAKRMLQQVPAPKKFKIGHKSYNAPTLSHLLPEPMNGLRASSGDRREFRALQKDLRSPRYIQKKAKKAERKTLRTEYDAFQRVYGRDIRPKGVSRGLPEETMTRDELIEVIVAELTEGPADPLLRVAKGIGGFYKKQYQSFAGRPMRALARSQRFMGRGETAIKRGLNLEQRAAIAKAQAQLQHRLTPKRADVITRVRNRGVSMQAYGYVTKRRASKSRFIRATQLGMTGPAVAAGTASATPGATELLMALGPYSARYGAKGGAKRAGQALKQGGGKVMHLARKLKRYRSALGA